MKTVIEMAREAGLLPLLDEDCFQSMGTKNFEATKRVLERFAELVRADERNRLAYKLQQDFKGAFGQDTCSSWASWLRSQK